MPSPNNPLNQRALERTTATYFIIYIVNQLFLSNNDVIELGWLECEFYATETTKWDGFLFKVGNSSCSSGFIEFSGGCNNNTPGSKNQRDIIKLYPKMMDLLQSDNTRHTKIFCMCYFSKITVYLSIILCSITILSRNRFLLIFPFTMAQCSELFM